MNRIKKIVTSTLIVGFSVVILPISSIAYASPLLRMGSRGDDVKEVQRQLLNRELVKSSHITGYYGPITYDAVKKFQSQNGLSVDGIVGPATRAKLNISGGTSNSESQGTIESKELFKLGTSHPEVSNIQRRLKDLGYYTYSRITQYYGPITQEAVIKFQRANGLSADGIAGPATLTKLGSPADVVEAADGSGNSSSPGRPSTNSLLRLGTRGSEVSDVQRRLKELGFYKYPDITGYYGSITQNAVREFQRANRLAADGIVGNITRDKLFGSNAKPANEDSGPSRGDGSSAQSDADSIIEFAKQFKGIPYRYGGNGPSSFDCSGFTTYVFKNFGINLPRTASDQANSNIGMKIANSKDLAPGDLVYFTNNRGGGSRPIHHTGIYIGGGDFIHASSSKSGSGVKISTLSSGWYKDGFCWGRRVLR